MSMLRNFWADESGPELVEWAVVTIILLVAALVLYVAVGKVLGNVICSIYCWLDLAKNRDGSLAETERGELEEFERLEHLGRLLSAAGFELTAVRRLPALPSVIVGVA